MVHGGSSGIGLTAIQLAHASSAPRSPTSPWAPRPEGRKRAGELGARSEAILTTAPEDFAVEIQRLTGGRGVDVVLDMVGAPYTVRNVRSLAMDGRLVQIAFLEGSKVEGFDLGPVMTRRLTITGSTMRPRTSAQKGEIARALRARVWPLLEAGRCGPVIHATFPLAEAAQAHALMESSAHVGKIMLHVAD